MRRPRVRGVMVAVFDGPCVLLVRHTYGARHRWELPGGWIHADEPASEAGVREVAEELGISVSLSGPSGVIEGDWDFKRESLSWFVAPWPGGHGSYDPVEIAEVGWFDVGALPPSLGGGARAVLGELASAS